MDAIEREDEDAVAACVLPAKDPFAIWKAVNQRDSIRCFIAASKLEWLAEEQFGQGVWAHLFNKTGIGFVRHINPAKVRWNQDFNGYGGGADLILADGSVSGMKCAFMAPTPEGWKLDRWKTGGASPMGNGPVDIAWRAAWVRRVLDDLRKGKIKSENELISALQLHAPDKRPTTIEADRSTPEGAILALVEALNKGDVETIANEWIQLRGWDGRYERAYARNLIMRQRLANTIRAKFDAKDAAELIAHTGLAQAWLEPYRKAFWVVEEDVARAAYDPPVRYEPGIRMVRSNGKWHIGNDGLPFRQMPPGARERMAANTEWLRRILENEKNFQRREQMDKALNPEPKNFVELLPELTASGMAREEEAEQKREHATQPKGSQ